MTQGISGSGARRWSVRKHCRAGQVSDNSARWLTCLGGRGKADCGTQAERTWSRGPAGSVTRRRFAYFAAGGKVGRPAGRNPLEAETVGRREAPSSVTASAVTPSPEGKAFGGHSVGRATLPQGEAAQTRWKRSFGRGAHCAPLLLFFVKLD